MYRTTLFLNLLNQHIVLLFTVTNPFPDEDIILESANPVLNKQFLRGSVTTLESETESKYIF